MPGDFRSLLSADPNIGAGNFFFRYADSVARPDDLLFETEEVCRIGEHRIGPRVTVGDFRAAAEAVACWYSDLGIGVKDLVAIYLDNPLAYFIHYVALTRIGAIAALINYRLELPAATEYLAQVRPLALVVSPKRYGLVKSSRGLGNLPIYTDLRVDFSRREAQPIRVHQHHEDDPVLVAHTSGTTGTPKAVQFNHAGFFHGVKCQLDHYFGKTVLSALPYSHGAAFTFFMSCVGRGIPMILTPATADNVLTATAARRPHMVFAFPNVFVDMCRRPLRDYDLSSVRIWMSTGDASHERHIRQILSHSSPGADETSTPVYIDNLGSSELAFAALRNVHTPRSDRYDRCVGKPYRWANLAIFRDDGELAADGEIGRLGVKSESVTVGYWNNSLMTEKSRWRGFWLTGDFVYRNADGFYYHLDRTADKIPHERRPVYSLQLEERLLKEFPEILDCSVVEYAGGIERGSLALSVEPTDRDFDIALLTSRINRYLADNDLLRADKIVAIESGWCEGITGKKLKRQIRHELAGEGLRSGTKPRSGVTMMGS
jgi:long-chain acyl-CoA synthetase